MSLDPDQARQEMRAAAEDEAQDGAARDALYALASGFKSLEKSMQGSQAWYSVISDSNAAMSEIPRDHFSAFAALSGTAASLVSGAASLIEDGNHYAASALTRQLVEVEYLAWAFGNDLDEVQSWYGSSFDQRRKRWTPSHLRQRSNGKFRGKDYRLHCERGGHPTPEGMRELLYGDEAISSAFGRYEVLSHGYSAWRYAIAAVDALCARFGVDPMLAVPAALDATDAAWDHYSEVEKLSKVSKRVLPRQDQSDPRD